MFTIFRHHMQPDYILQQYPCRPWQPHSAIVLSAPALTHPLCKERSRKLLTAINQGYQMQLQHNISSFKMTQAIAAAKFLCVPWFACLRESNLLLLIQVYNSIAMIKSPKVVPLITVFSSENCLQGEYCTQLRQ